MVKKTLKCANAKELEIQKALGVGKDKNVEDNVDQSSEANFETAIAATGFGKFNLLLYLIAFPAGMANFFVTTTMSFVIPVAECDLNLTLENKGTLNAITYLGMISSGFIWGYLSDTMGRRKLLIAGYISTGVIVVVSGFSQQYKMLVALKFLEGLIINGPFSVLVSYLNEFHCAKYRLLLPPVNGLIFSASGIVLPLLGWLILTKPIEINLADVVVLRSWNVFLLVCSIPSLIAGVSFIFFPESPKFLMTSGNNEQAYSTLQKVYSYNNGNAKNNYPIKSLTQEVNATKCIKNGRSKMLALRDGWKQIVPLFHSPYGGKILLVAIVQILVMMGLNTLRLWLPQLFAVISSYQATHKDTDETANICDMTQILRIDKSKTNETCFVDYSNIGSAYTNNIIVALAGILCNLIAAVLMHSIGKKYTLVLFSSIGGICGICMYFAQNEITAVALSSVCLGLTGICSNTVLSIIVDIFPTTLRTMTVALAMIFGRSGAMTGNLIFPKLLSAGCLPSFLTIGSLPIGGALLALLLPKTDTKELE